MKKETAVEWFLKQLLANGDITWKGTSIFDLSDQAKEMEKTQILDSYVYGSAYGTDPKQGYCAVYYYQSTYEREANLPTRKADAPI